MYGWSIETWEVRNTGTDPRVPVDEYPMVQTMRMVVRDERGRFHGATNFRPRQSKAEKKKQHAGTSVSRRARGLRLVN